MEIRAEKRYLSGSRAAYKSVNQIHRERRMKANENY
jgi:hypothetical protein